MTSRIQQIRERFSSTRFIKHSIGPRARWVWLIPQFVLIALIELLIILLMRVSHSVLAIGGLLCVLASIVAWIGIVVNDEFRTARTVLFATGTLAAGLACCAVQLTLYKRWKDDLH